jgi:tetratricopeptide (TPR) repeat protein
MDMREPSPSERSRRRRIQTGVRTLAILLLFSPLANPQKITLAKDDPSQLLIAAGRVDDAIHSLDQQISRNSRDAESYNLLCRAHFMLEEWDRAIAACDRAVLLEPQNSRYHLWLGRAYGEKADRAGFLSAAGMVKRVHGEFERAVELDPKSWEARTDLAEFYLEAPGMVGGGKDKARAQAQQLMSLKPAMAHYILGRIGEKNKDMPSAEREYRAAIDASEGGAHAWLNLALFYRHTNRFDEMERALETMESRPLDRPESLMDGGSILLRTGRNYPFGVRLVKKYLSLPAVEEGPSFKAHYVLGELLEKQGDRKAAAEEYREALAMAHSYTRAQEALKRVER